MSIILSGSSSVGATPLTYEWSTLDGYIDGVTNTSAITVVTAGTYTLKITDSEGGMHTSNFSVTQSTSKPLVNITTNTGNNSLSGGGGSLILTGSTSVGTEFKWVNSLNEVVSITNILTVTEIGEYKLIVTNLLPTVQGCYRWNLNFNSDSEEHTGVGVIYKDCNNETQELRTKNSVAFCSYYPVSVDLNGNGYETPVNLGVNLGINGSLIGGTDEGTCVSNPNIGCEGEQVIIITV